MTVGLNFRLPLFVSMDLIRHDGVQHDKKARFLLRSYLPGWISFKCRVARTLSCRGPCAARRAEPRSRSDPRRRRLRGRVRRPCRRFGNPAVLSVPFGNPAGDGRLEAEETGWAAQRAASPDVLLRHRLRKRDGQLQDLPPAAAFRSAAAAALAVRARASRVLCF